MSKAAVAFEVKQLHLEEPSLTVLGLSPGLCDTKMVQDLKVEGACESTQPAFSGDKHPLTMGGICR